MPKLQLPPETVDVPQLVDLINGRAKGRTNEKQTSFFLNVGAIGAQFEGVAAAVYNSARERGLEIPRIGPCRISGTDKGFGCARSQQLIGRWLRIGFLTVPAATAILACGSTEDASMSKAILCREEATQSIPWRRSTGGLSSTSNGIGSEYSHVNRRVLVVNEARGGHSRTFSYCRRTKSSSPRPLTN